MDLERLRRFYDKNASARRALQKNLAKSNAKHKRMAGNMAKLGAGKDVFATVMQEHQACLDRGELQTTTTTTTGAGGGKKK